MEATAWNSAPIHSLNTKVGQNPISHDRGNMISDILEDKTQMLPKAMQLGDVEFSANSQLEYQNVPKSDFPRQRKIIFGILEDRPSMLAISLKPRK